MKKLVIFGLALALALGLSLGQAWAEDDSGDPEYPCDICGTMTPEGELSMVEDPDNPGNFIVYCLSCDVDDDGDDSEDEGCLYQEPDCDGNPCTCVVTCSGTCGSSFPPDQLDENGMCQCCADDMTSEDPSEDDPVVTSYCAGCGEDITETGNCSKNCTFCAGCDEWYSDDDPECGCEYCDGCGINLTAGYPCSCDICAECDANITAGEDCTCTENDDPSPSDLIWCESCSDYFDSAHPCFQKGCLKKISQKKGQ